MTDLSASFVPTVPGLDATRSRDDGGDARDRPERAGLEPRNPSDDIARWHAWTARHAASDRRTTRIMRLLFTVMLLGAAGWVVIALLTRP